MEESRGHKRAMRSSEELRQKVWDHRELLIEESISSAKHYGELLKELDWKDPGNHAAIHYYKIQFENFGLDAEKWMNNIDHKR
jgi:hypothetical protein